MSRSIYIAVPLMLLLIIGQTAVLTSFPILGVVPQLLFLLAVAHTLIHGVWEGALWAFVAGFWVDLFSISPMGSSSLAMMVAVVIIYAVQVGIPANRFLLTVVLTVLATFIYFAVYVTVLRVTGYDVAWSLIAATAPPLALLHALLILPIYGLHQSVTYWLVPPRLRM